MDPDETLRQIRNLYSEEYPTEEDIVELAQLIQDLDEWLSRGDRLPAAWCTIKTVNLELTARPVLEGT